MAVVSFDKLDDSNDEVSQFQTGRCISSYEAMWRIFSSPSHNRHSNIVHLSVHLENGQKVYFTDENSRNVAVTPAHTTLKAFFELCREDEFSITLLYTELSKYYTWNTTSKKFHRRKQGTWVEGYQDHYSSNALGRVYTVHPNNVEYC